MKAYKTNLPSHLEVIAVGHVIDVALMKSFVLWF